MGPLAIGFGKVAQGISTTVKTGQQFASFVGGIIAKITAKTAATAAGTAADTAGQQRRQHIPQQQRQRPE